jgi:hypothetical protein
MKFKLTLLFLPMVLFIAMANGQTSGATNDGATKSDGAGVAISPSTVKFNASPGSVMTRTVKISNDTKRDYSFQLFFQDYQSEGLSGVETIPQRGYRHSLSRYVVASPSFVELKAGQSKVVTITLNVPFADSNAIAMWTQLIIDQVFERKPLETPRADKSTIGFGITSGIGFGVKILQNPPNVKSTNVEITRLKYQPADKSKKKNGSLQMRVRNSGDGVGYCLYYIELTNLATGRQSKVKVKQFSILPGDEREMSFDLTKDYISGNYSAVAVLDFGDAETLQTAEIEFRHE